MTKQNEINKLDEIIATLPDSYLRDTLRHIRIQFEQDIRSDFPTLPNLNAITSDIIAARQELKNLETLLATKRDNVEMLESRAGIAQRGIDTAKRQLHELAHNIIDITNRRLS